MADEILQADMEIRTYREIEHGHAHDYHQILLPLAGELDLEIAGHAGMAGGQAGALIAGGDHHLFRCETQSRFLVLDLPGHFLQLRPNKRHVSAKASGFFRMSQALSHLSRYAESCLSSDDYRNLRSSILPLVHQTLQAEGLTTDNPTTGKLTAICRMIEENLENPPTQRQLANIWDMSEEALCKLFRTWLDCSPSDYLRKRRLDKASHLITHTDLPLAQIALMAGFSEQSAMTRCFRREQGITPGKLRRSRKLH